MSASVEASELVEKTKALPQVVKQGIEDKYVYTKEAVNKSYEKREISLRLVSPTEGVIRMVSRLSLDKNDLNESVFFLDIPKRIISSTRVPITIEVLSDGIPIEIYETAFVAPLN